MRRHIDATWEIKTGKHFIWTPLYRKNLWTMMQVFKAGEVMAMWDLYIERERSVYRLIYMERLACELMGDPRFKKLRDTHDEWLWNLGRR